MKIWAYIETVCAMAGGLIGYFFGSFSDGLIKALFIITVIDYITGVVKAVMRRNLSSEIGYKGIVKKFMMFLIVGVANIIDEHLFVMLTFTGSDGNIMRDAVILFFIVNECISILENAVLAGVPVPEQLRGALLQFRDKGKKTVPNESGGADRTVAGLPVRQTGQGASETCENSFGENENMTEKPEVPDFSETEWNNEENNEENNNDEYNGG